MVCQDCLYWDEQTEECNNKDSNYYLSMRCGDDGCSL